MARRGASRRGPGCMPGCAGPLVPWALEAFERFFDGFELFFIGFEPFFLVLRCRWSIRGIPEARELTLKYLDDEGDLCTLLPVTMPDFLTQKPQLLIAEIGLRAPGRQVFLDIFMYFHVFFMYFSRFWST